MLRLVRGAQDDVSDDDDALMARVARDDLAAFSTLVKRHEARARGVARRRLGDAALAEEVVQSAFLDLHRARARYEGTGRFRSYLYTLLLNQCRMAERKRRARAWLTLSFSSSSASSPKRGAPLEHDLVVEPTSLEDKCERERVLAAVDTLPAAQRDVVLLRYVADLSLSDIARALYVPEGTVKSRLHHALAALKAMLPEER